MRTLLLASMTVLMGLQAHATAPQLTLKDGKIYAPVKGSPATAGYGTFTNPSDKEMKLSIESAKPFTAVELHETLEKDGKMAMQKIDSLVIPAKGNLELKPGGHHIMLFDPKTEVKANDTVKVVIKVDGKNKDFEFKVVPRVESSTEHHHHH